MECEIKIDDKKNKIYAPLKDKWLVKTPEEEVRQKYICNLINHYGFSLEQMKQEVTVSNSSRGQGRAQADIVVWKNKEDKNEDNSPVIVVECKAENITIREEDCFQGSNYASWAGADFFVTTNLKETRVFKVVKGKIPKRLEEIIDIPDAKIINNEKKIGELLKQTKAFTRDEFSKVLFQCHNIIRNNDKLSPEAAFDEISKVLFIKIRYERDNNEAQIFSKKRFIENQKNYNKLNDEMGVTDAKPFYQQLFEKTKQDFKQDDLFAENETLRIRENSFEAIVEKLEKYNLSTTSDDVKGIAFEKFLGRTFRGELGQFFTPRTIVDFMVDVLDPQEGEIVLPEGVLNNSNLQKIRDFVESKAKIVLITSIPQDVFIASGATVKPSLLFFKKFTEDEAKQWEKIAKKAEKDIEKKYEEQTKPIKEKLALRGKDAPNANEKKQLRKELKALQEKIETEIKAEIKANFDYQIPIAEVEKAGISTTGAQIENELEPLAKEFTEYRKENNLWQGKFDEIKYDLDNDGNFYRQLLIGADRIAQEPEVFYGK